MPIDLFSQSNISQRQPRDLLQSNTQILPSNAQKDLFANENQQQLPDDTQEKNAFLSKLLPALSYMPDTARMTYQAMQPLLQHSVSPEFKSIPEIDSANADIAIPVFNAAASQLPHGEGQPLMESGLFGENVKKASEDLYKRNQGLLDVSKEKNPLTTGIFSTAGQLGSMIPHIAINYMAPEKIGAQMLAGGASTGLLGASQYVPGNSWGARAANGAMGVALGAVAPPIAAGISKFADFLDKPMNAVQNKISSYILKGTDPEATIARKAAGERVGVTLRPEEASASPYVGKKVGQIGITDKGALDLQKSSQERLAQEKASINKTLDVISEDKTPAQSYIRANAKRIQQETEAPIIKQEQGRVNQFLDDVSPNQGDVTSDVRKILKNHLDDQQHALDAKVKPLYEKAYHHKVAPTKIKSLMSQDGAIETSINQVLKDPNYRAELEGYAPNSIKVLDLAKRRIDAQIAQAKGTPINPGDNDLVRVLSKSKERLVNAIDSYSDDYAQARRIFSEEVKPINVLRDSPVGKIASMDDIQLKNTGKTIFDPNQTNPKDLETIRNIIHSKSPETWSASVRQEFERRLAKGKGVNEARDFLKTVFRNQNDINQFMVATEKNPQLQKEMQSLINDYSKQESALDLVRNGKIYEISKLDDTELNKVGRILFDPSQTSPKIMRDLHKKFDSKAPGLWNRSVRNFLEDAMNQSQIKGNTFYRTHLLNDKKYNMLQTALEGNPNAQQRVRDTRLAFEHLVDQASPRAAVKLSATGMSLPRSSAQYIEQEAIKKIGKKYDEAAVKFITSKDWDKAYQEIRKVTNRGERARLMVDLFAKMSTEGLSKQTGDQSQGFEDFKKSINQYEGNK